MPKGKTPSADIESELDNGQPVELTSNTDQSHDKLKHLFSINGQPYYIVDKPRPNIALRALWDLKTKGEEISQMNMLIEMIGEDGFQALTNYEDLTTEDLQRIVKIANDTAMGTLESVTGEEPGKG